MATGSYDQAGNQTLNTANLAMGYNPKNQTSTFAPSGGSAINATYQDAGQIGRTQLGTTTSQNGALGLYSETTGSNSTYYTRLPSGTHQAIGQIINSTRYYYLTDLHGSVVKMTNSTGVVQNTYSYDPNGTKLASTGTTANAIQYAGGYFDTATGLNKFGARYYNSTEARWTQLDPSGQEAGYVYANANPINFSDPTGYVSLSGVLTGLSVGFGLGAAGCGAGAFLTSVGVITAPAAIPFGACGVVAGVASATFGAAAFLTSGGN